MLLLASQVCDSNPFVFVTLSEKCYYTFKHGIMFFPRLVTSKEPSTSQANLILVSSYFWSVLPALTTSNVVCKLNIWQQNKFPLI